MPEQTLLDVAEIFTSLQGEGPFAGQPSVFVRLAGCVPPFCPHCDTPQALDTADAKTIRMSPAQILRHVAQYPDFLVVITGGEPFRQWDTGLAELAAALHDRKYRIQYETSGKAGIPERTHGVVVCSPKPMDAPALDPEFLPRVHVFKFVVGDDPDPILHFIHDNRLEAGKVWLMPLGATRTEQMSRLAAIWELCVQHGFNFAPRLHILTFDDKKGV